MRVLGPHDYADTARRLNLSLGRSALVSARPACPSSASQSVSCQDWRQFRSYAKALISYFVKSRLSTILYSLSSNG